MFKAMREAREAYVLGRRLQAAIERGRKLHPWVSRTHSLAALEEEVYELRLACASEKEHRICEEAVDVTVVALRIGEGR